MRPATLVLIACSTLLNEAPNVQVSDTTKVDQGFAAGNKIEISFL